MARVELLDAGGHRRDTTEAGLYTGYSQSQPNESPVGAGGSTFGPPTVNNYGFVKLRTNQRLVKVSEGVGRSVGHGQGGRSAVERPAGRCNRPPSVTR